MATALGPSMPVLVVDNQAGGTRAFSAINQGSGTVFDGSATAINAGRVLVIMRQSRRSFVERIDFRTSPGHSGDRDHDAARGWLGEGPTSVITDLATYGFDEATGEMTLLTLHPGVTFEDVREATEWEPRVAGDVGETPAPTDEELRLIREELDPLGVTTR